MNEHFENFLKAGLYLRGWSTRTPVIYPASFHKLPTEPA
jgi:hypothetical protein